MKKLTVSLVVLCVLSSTAFGSDAEDFRFYSNACNNGDFPSCNNVGSMYNRGVGVQQDRAKALKYYTKACSGGSFASCNNLGAMYALGTGVQQDNVKAKALFKKSCAMNNEDGCKNYALLSQ